MVPGIRSTHKRERAFICTLHQRLRAIEAEQTAAPHP